MRIGVCVISAIAVAACGNGPTAANLTLAPPTLAVSGTTRVVLDATGHPQLEVTALVRNPNSVHHIVVGTGIACPLYVRIFPDASGAIEGSSSGPANCPVSAFTLDLGPGDSATLTKILPVDSLAAFSPGLYGVNVGIATSTSVIGAWAGTIRMPISTQP